MLRVLVFLLAAGVFYAHAAETGEADPEKGNKEEFKPANNRPLTKPMSYPQQPSPRYGSDYYPTAIGYANVPVANSYYPQMARQQLPGPQAYPPYNVLPAAANPSGQNWPASPQPDNTFPNVNNFDGQSGVTVFDPNMNPRFPTGVPSQPDYPATITNEPRWVDGTPTWNPQPQMAPRTTTTTSFGNPFGGIATSPGTWMPQQQQQPVQSSYYPSTAMYGRSASYPSNVVPDTNINPTSTFTAGRPTWRRSYTPIPGRSGCFNRCQPRCGPYGCQASCRPTCSLRPNCGQTRPIYQGKSMVCGNPSSLGNPFRNVATPFYGGVTSFNSGTSPSYGNVPPSYGNVPPSYGNVAPSYGNVAPSYGNVAPSYGSVVPSNYPNTWSGLTQRQQHQSYRGISNLIQSESVPASDSSSAIASDASNIVDDSSDENTDFE